MAESVPSSPTKKTERPNSFMAISSIRLDRPCRSSSPSRPPTRTAALFTIVPMAYASSVQPNVRRYHRSFSFKGAVRSSSGRFS